MLFKLRNKGSRRIVFFESHSVRDRRVPESSHLKSSKGKRRQDSNHTHSSTDLPCGGKLVAGIKPAINMQALSYTAGSG